MSNTFNERTFDDINSEMLKTINEGKNSAKMTMNDYENIINDRLNDEVLLKKISRNDIIKYTTLIKDEINKNVFDINYVKSRVKKVKELNKLNTLLNENVAKSRNILQKIDYRVLIKTISKTTMNISKDVVLFFFTICIVAHLRMRSFIKSCYLYPSDPNRFPYIFYNPEKKEQNQILSMTNTQTEVSVEPVFNNVRLFTNSDASISRDKSAKLNDMCSGKEDSESSMLESATKLLIGDGVTNTDDEKYATILERITDQLNGTTQDDKLEKLNVSSKTFMEEHREKCPDELSIYSLVTYMMYYNTIKNRESIAYLHNGLFKYLTSSSSKLQFGIIVILLHSMFKNNVGIAERFVNNIMDYYSNRYDGGGNLHTFFIGILASGLAPFVTFSLLLMIVLYPMSIFYCMKSYFNYVGLTEQFSTKIVCYIGIVYSIIALVLYSIGLLTTIFPEVLRYVMKELKHMSNAGKKKGGKSKKGGKNKKGKGVKEGFEGEKGCSLNNFNIAKLFGRAMLVILGLFTFMPVIMPFVCAFMSSFGIASSLTFDSLKFMKNNMCSVKEYSSVIKILLGLILVHQIIKRYLYGAGRNKWIVIGVYIFTLVIYGAIESRDSPTEKYFDELKCND